MTQAILLTRRGVELHNSNPFMTGLGVRSRTKRIVNKRGDMSLVNYETGEVKAQIAGFWEAEEVDTTKFIKLFVNGVKALAELTNAGTKVFELLYIEMQNSIGKDSVYLSYSALNPRQDISRSTFARGLSELIEKKFIAAQPAVCWYWGALARWVLGLWLSSGGLLPWGWTPIGNTWKTPFHRAAK